MAYTSFYDEYKTHAATRGSTVPRHEVREEEDGELPVREDVGDPRVQGLLTHEAKEEHREKTGARLFLPLRQGVDVGGKSRFGPDAERGVGA